ncbi:hypothetical protein F1737_08530 [Methanoplanus sp. FWC-SCC4]|uniref:Archaeal Type IV pilin N-terminal domain-containing protein n=1 Tax=Methanochimaera problematica TaxID=2609417 RepID=A0AA97FCW3_9EURY|nr:hypothetical protein [Methanoplanus sp. FWC-SCC4]WOF16732.1 hypothetical protein F1737_08530 [Methanoplanus sp. FWC-SCC4]
MNHNFKKPDESGVSEAIGFIIMFSIVLTGIAMVTLYGYPLLLESQISSDERTMEQTMITLQNEMKILTFSNVPYRDISIRVSGGFLDAIDNGNSVEKFTISYPDTAGANVDYEFAPGALRYTSGEGDTVLSIQNGALVSRQKFQTGSAMVAEPRWFFDDSTKTLVMSLIKIKADREYSLGGIGNLQMSMLDKPETKADINFIASLGVSQTVRVKYEPDPDDDYSLAWKNYLTGDSVLQDGFSPSGNSYQINGVERLVLKEYTIKIENL